MRQLIVLAATLLVCSTCSVLLLAQQGQVQTIRVQDPATGVAVHIGDETNTASRTIVVGGALSALEQIQDNTDILNMLSEPAVQGNAYATAPDGIPMMLGANAFDGTVIPQVVVEGQYVRPAASLYGVQMILPTTFDGAKSPLALEDDVAAALGAGFRMFFTRCDTAAASGANGDLVDPCTTSTGELWVRDTNSAAALTAAQAQASAIGLEDAPETAGGGLTMMGAVVRNPTAGGSSGTLGDNATLNVDQSGFLITRTVDPCSGLKTSIAIDIVTASTAGTGTELTPALAGASTNYYICSIDLVTAGANNVALVDDDSDGCGSVTSGLAGGATAAEGWNFAANGGLSKGNGTGTVYKTNGANRVVCLMTGSAVQLSGSIQVVAAP